MHEELMMWFLNQYKTPYNRIKDANLMMMDVF